MHDEYVTGDGEIVKRDRTGHEKLDPTPAAIPLRFTRAASLNEVVRRMVRSEELARLAEQSGAETWEEADDFDVGEDYEPTSPYEEEFEGLPVKRLKELKLVDEEKASTEVKQEGAAPPAAVDPPGASGDGR